jgi:hypothetical protein
MDPAERAQRLHEMRAKLAAARFHKAPPPKRKEVRKNIKTERKKKHDATDKLRYFLIGLGLGEVVDLTAVEIKTFMQKNAELFRQLGMVEDKLANPELEGLEIKDVISQAETELGEEEEGGTATPTVAPAASS